MTPFDLSGKHILVTGASSGIGAATARTLSNLGATVSITARNEERLANVLASLNGSNHSMIPADLTCNEDVDRLVNDLLSLDGIVHSCGIVKAFPVKFIAKKQYEELFNVNYLAPVILNSKLFKAKKINKGASFVFISSISSKHSYKGGALYSGSKAAINAYSKALALEYATKNIRSNVLLAGMVRTPLFDQAEEAVTKEMMDKHGEAYPLGFGEAEDVANAVAFFLSSASKWITGSELIMDGGLTAGH